MSKFKFKCKQCGKEKEVNTQQEAEKRTYCSRKCVGEALAALKAAQSAMKARNARMNKIAGIKTTKSKTEGVQIVDMEIPKRIYKRKEILLAIRNMSETLDNKYPSETQWREQKGAPHRDYIVKLFGSWKQAVIEAKSLPAKQIFTLHRTRLY